MVGESFSTLPISVNDTLSALPFDPIVKVGRLDVLKSHFST
jgi:hypothetical protein